MGRSAGVRAALFLIVVLELAIPPFAWSQGHRYAEQQSAERALLAAANQSDLLGEVHFPTSCSADAQEAFDRAVALLHSFWRGPALEAFARAGELDSGCGIAYWGTAMALLINPFGEPSRSILQDGRAAIERATAVGAGTEREREYIAAIGAFYGDSDETSLGARRLAYEEEMDRLHARYREDDEAAGFYALSLVLAADPTDLTYEKQLKAAAILEPLFAIQPNHPGVAHYLIHAYDSPSLAPLGLEAARRYAGIAPSVPHALHMPSHIFHQLGLWEESIVTNRAAAATPTEEFGHVSDYMMYAFCQLAQDRAAEALVGETRGRAGTNAAAIPARYALERGQWTEAMGLVPRARAPARERAVTYGARALGAARSGDLSTTRENVELLAGLTATRTIDLWRQQAEAWLALAEGRTDEATDLMRSAADREEETDPELAPGLGPGPVLPARELLGEMLLDIGDPRAAAIAFAQSLRRTPNRFRGIYGAAVAAELSGELAAAAGYYTRLLELASRADSDRPELQRARAFLGFYAR